MAKKNGVKVVKERNSLIKLSCFVALITAAALSILNVILSAIDGDLGKAMGIIDFICKIATCIALGLGGYAFSRGKGIVIKISFWVALVAYLIFNLIPLF